MCQRCMLRTNRGTDSALLRGSLILLCCARMLVPATLIFTMCDCTQDDRQDALALASLRPAGLKPIAIVSLMRALTWSESCWLGTLPNTKAPPDSIMSNPLARPRILSMLGMSVGSVMSLQNTTSIYPCFIRSRTLSTGRNLAVGTQSPTSTLTCLMLAFTP